MRSRGTPEEIADLIEDWFASGPADGFNVMPPIITSQLELFATEVLPLLRKRGLFREEYEGRSCASISGRGRSGRDRT